MAAIHTIDNRRKSYPALVKQIAESTPDPIRAALSRIGSRNHKLVPNNTATVAVQAHYRR